MLRLKVVVCGFLNFSGAADLPILNTYSRRRCASSMSSQLAETQGWQSAPGFHNYVFGLRFRISLAVVASLSDSDAGLAD